MSIRSQQKVLASTPPTPQTLRPWTGLRVTVCECPVILNLVKNLARGAHAMNIKSQLKGPATPQTLRPFGRGLRMTGCECPVILSDS